jgi:hypothetical protein
MITTLFMKTIPVLFFIPTPGSPTVRRHLDPVPIPTLGGPDLRGAPTNPPAAKVILFGVVAKESQSLGQASRELAPGHWSATHFLCIGE